jgi:hypothetical protein
MDAVLLRYLRAAETLQDSNQPLGVRQQKVACSWGGRMHTLAWREHAREDLE